MTTVPFVRAAPLAAPAQTARRTGYIASVALLATVAEVAHANTPDPTSATNTWLASFSFSDTTNWTSDYGYAPISFTNLGSYSTNGATALVVDRTNAARLNYNITESGGW